VEVFLERNEVGSSGERADTSRWLTESSGSLSPLLCSERERVGSAPAPVRGVER
jgi:hypothetical protein